MYNSDTPSQAELPSSNQLIKSTILAAIAAIVILFTVLIFTNEIFDLKYNTY